MRDRIKRILEAELASPEFTRFYKYLKFTCFELEAFPTYSDLILFLHDRKNQDYQAKDRLLKSLIAQFQQFNDGLLANLLMIIFYPGIEKLFFDNIRYFHNEEDDLLSEIRSSLLDVIAEYDCDDKPSKVAATVLGRARNRLRTAKKELLSKFDAVDITTVDIQTDKPVSGETHLLKLLVRKKVITEEDEKLIIETRINEVLLKDMASQIGVSYEALRKRRQRAEKKIRMFIEQQRGIYARMYGLSEKSVSFQQIISWIDKK